MKKKYYKVVSLMSDDYTSATPGINGPVTYKINEWTYPKLEKTSLFVFDDLRKANSFRNWDEGIFECEVKNPRTKGFFIRFDSRIDKVRKLQLQKKRFLHLCDIPPEGTVFVSGVKLTKRVG